MFSAGQPQKRGFQRHKLPVRSPNLFPWKSVVVRHQADIDAFENLPQVPDCVRYWAPINRRWGCSVLQGIKLTMCSMAFDSHQKELSCCLIGIVAIVVLRQCFILGTSYFAFVHARSYILTWSFSPCTCCGFDVS